MERGGGERLNIGEEKEQITADRLPVPTSADQEYRAVNLGQEVGPAPTTTPESTEPTDQSPHLETVSDFTAQDLSTEPPVEDLGNLEDRISAHMEGE
jgi:hypothetical protein